MNIDKLERANFLAKVLIPEADAILCSHRHTNERIGECVNDLSKYDKEFNSKFTQILKETKQRFQKEFDEL